MSDTTAPVATDGQGAAPSVAPAAAATPPSAAPEWLAGAPEDISAFVQTKGWKTPVDALESYRNLEKYMGTPADRLARIPEWDKADKSEIDAFFGKLGRPSDPKEYKLPVPEGADPAFATAAAAKFHELGLTAKQAQALAEWNNNYATEAQAKMTESYQQTVAAQEAELKREWGSAYDQNVIAAKGAAAQLGLDAQKIDALERVLGFDGLMKMMADVGSKIGEDKFVSGQSQAPGFGAMTPAQAKAKIDALGADQGWVAKYLAGNAEARAEMERLQKFAYPT